MPVSSHNTLLAYSCKSLFHTSQIACSIIDGYLHHERNRGSKVSGVKRIRVHDLRHSHVSLLINMGFTVLAIADRMGHESIDITYRYAHLFPSEQTQMAEQLDIERMEKLNGEKSGQ